MEEQITDLSLEFSELILPYLAVMISIVFFLWFKDFATGLAKGLKFKIDPHFQEGDQVWYRSFQHDPSNSIELFDLINTSSLFILE